MSKTAAQWLDDISRRLRALRKHWLDDAEKCVDIYEAQDSVPFNILYSNTETLFPALYNSTPRPEVIRRYTQIDVDRLLDSALAQSGERLLEYLADSNVLEYETFDSCVRNAVLGALVPGAGIARVRYKEEGGYQEISFESVPFDRFVWGYARKWCHVPWVAYGHDYSKADFEKAFPEFARKEVFRELNWDEELAGDDPEEAARQRSEDGTQRTPTLLVWEIWDSVTRTIHVVCARFRDSFIRSEPYPFDLSARFPSPQPLTLVKRNNDLTPLPLYELYRRQAEELNEVTRRLHIVLKAIKVRGGYNAQMTEIAQILESDDTALVPIENASLMGESGSFERHIWMLPINELIMVARELYQAQLNAKNTIYEIMGIADIQRGASIPSETARAQEIKDRWGTLRIKRMQTEVKNFCRDLFRIAFEFGAALYTPATLKTITKLPYLLDAEKRALASTAQMQPESPELAAKLPLLQAPSWEDISRLLQDAYERTYRIDVETNSTVDLEATEDKQEIAEFMNAWGQMMSGFQPLVERGVMPFEVLKLVMGEVFRRFRFSRRVEGALEMVQPPQPTEDPAAKEERYKAELAAARADAKRQIGEMQETVIEMTGEIERLRIENMALKKSTELVQEAGKLEATRVATDGKIREHVLQKDYAGKMQLQQQQSAAREQKLREELVKNEISTQLAAKTAVMQTLIAPLAQAIGAQREIITNALTALAEQISNVARLAAAEREAELFIGPDGKKRSRSRVVLPQQEQL